MNRRTLLGRVAAIVAAVGLAPAVKAEAGPADVLPTTPAGPIWVESGPEGVRSVRPLPAQLAWKPRPGLISPAAWTALVAACTEQGHELSRAPWGLRDGVEMFLHHPYPSEKRADGSTWTERVESLTLGIDQDGDRAALLRGWLMGVHALGPAVPRVRPLSDWRTSLHVHEGG